MNTHRVLILGAGYAGVTAASRLARQVDTEAVTVTLVNAADTFVERPRLHQTAAGQNLRGHRLAELLDGSGVRLRIALVEDIDLDAHRVRLDDGTTLPYDTLVYALGSRTDTGAVPGITEHAHVLAGPEAAERLHRSLPERGTVAVCGGGLTGIEAATELAEAHPGLTVRLVSRGDPGGGLSPRAKRHVDRAFARLGVEVHAGADITEIADGHIRTAAGEAIDFDVCVWAGGFTVPGLAARAGLAVTPAGRAVVDPTLRSVSHPDVLVIGDAAALAGAWGTELAYGCRVGGFMGPYAADAIAAWIAGRTPKDFAFRYIHQCVSLGRRDAVIQFVDPVDESPRPVALTGKVAVWYKDIVLGSAIWLFRRPGPYGPRRKVLPVEPAASVR